MTNAADHPFRLLALAGELDLDRGVGARVEIDRALADRPSTLGLDLSQTTFLDCAGLRILLWAVLRAQSVGARVVLVSPSAAVTRMLTITDCQSYFALAS